MLEGPLKTWISYFLGQYVESQSVNVSSNLWKSSELLRLENLTLKKSILPTWFPFRLKTGFIGQFEAHLPITAIFGNRSAKIKFIDVLIVLAPLRYDDDEEEEERALLTEEKLQLLAQDLTDRWHGPRIPEYTVHQESEGYFGTDGWIGRTMTKLIDNLQIDVRNLHLRIEGTWYPTAGPRTMAPEHEHDDTGRKFAVGISLGALSAVTTPSNWRIDGFDDAQASESTETSSSSHLVFKLIHALELSAYVDPHALHFIHSRVHPRVLSSTLHRLKDMGAKATARVDWWTQREEDLHAHRFIIAPIAVSLKLTMNTAAQVAQTNDPRYRAQFHLSKVQMTLDEEQLSVLNLIWDSFGRHEQWRSMVSEHLKAMEHTSAREADHEQVEQYQVIWKKIIRMKKEGLEAVKKTGAWCKAMEIETKWPLELIISLRNQVELREQQPVDGPALNLGSYESLLHGLGDAMGIPLPEISVTFSPGPTGLVFDARKFPDAVVSRCVDNSFAAKKDAVRPGLLLIKIDGVPLAQAIARVNSASDLQRRLDAMMSSARVLTFRHPLVQPATVTPSQLVSFVSIQSDELVLYWVYAAQHKVLANLVLERPTAHIQGFGPELFAYHKYEVMVTNFFLQNTCVDERKYCVASSVCAESTVNDDLAIRFGMDYLHDLHPDAEKDNVATYGSKISCLVGGAMIVFDEDKMTRLLWEWNEFSNGISTQYMPSKSNEPVQLVQETNEPSIASITSTAPTSTTTDTTLVASSTSPASAASMSSIYSYDIAIQHLRFFVSAKKKEPPHVRLQHQPSYRVLLKQLVHNQPQMGVNVAVSSPRRRKSVTEKVVLIQKMVRGLYIRRRPMVELALHKRWHAGVEKLGWLFKRDDTLAFRRWHRVFGRLKENGSLTFYDDGPLGRRKLSKVNVTDVTLLFLPQASGPFGRSDACGVLEIRSRTAESQLLAVFSGASESELNEWKQCIETNTRANRERRRNEATRGMAESIESDTSDDEPPIALGPNQVIGHQQHGAFAEYLLVGGFTNRFELLAERQRAKSCWITLSLTDFVLRTDVHRSNQLEQTAFRLYLGAQYLTVTDQRKRSNHGMLHVGDEFLCLRNGVLMPAKVRSSDHRTHDRLIVLTLTYRGARVPASRWVPSRGLQVDLDITGWIMPLKLMELLYDAIETLDVLWTDPMMQPSASPSTHPSQWDSAQVSTDPWYRVTEIALQIRAPMLEAYVEDSHCVAKLTIEKSVLRFRATPSLESLSLKLGPTALFVLTNEVALRLAQVDKFWFCYDIKLTRDLANRHQIDCVICNDATDDKASIPLCHRRMTIAIGQVKLEADRRLELLFALLEALTQTDDGMNEEDHERQHTGSIDPVTGQWLVRSPTRSRDHLDSLRIDIDTMHSHSGLGVDPLRRSTLDPDDSRLQANPPAYDMSFTRPTASHYFHPSSPTATRRSRLSTGTSAPNNRSQTDGEGQPSKRQSDRNRRVIMPLLYYQTYIEILNGKRLFRPRNAYRVHKFHDRITLGWDSIVFEVIKRSLSMVALDTYIPVMNLSVSDMKLRLWSKSQCTSDLQLDASVELSARYYNTALADWEPFIEPWRAYAKYHWDDKHSGTSIEFSAMQRLNINFTDALVRLLCSVAKNRHKGHVFYMEKRSPAAIAADGESKKEDGRVCVLNNLGVPIRLANLNTFQSGTIHVEVRDGWSFPSYTRFHNVQVEIVLLPWWHPREAKHLESIRHKFSLPYGGAQSGVTPILRIDVACPDHGKKNFVFDHVTNKFVEVFDGRQGDEEEEEDSQDEEEDVKNRRLKRDDSDANLQTRWRSIGATEINLASSIMMNDRRKLCRWYRLHDTRGNATGEISIAIEFIPHKDRVVPAAKAPKLVKDGQYLVFDPLKIVKDKSDTSATPMEHVVLSESLRSTYIPPLALEVMIGNTTASLLCPMRRAGKFLIRGDKVLAEVKVAQRDESRRVLLLSSPVQLKNDTNVDMEFWTCPATTTEVNLYEKPDDRALPLKANAKLSVPLDAMVENEQHIALIQVAGCKPTVITRLSELVAGARILPLEPEDDETSGYCLYVKTTSFLRKVYREEQQNLMTRPKQTTGATGNQHNHHEELQSYETKYQICLHSCLVFENTLPIRVQYKIVARSTGFNHPSERILRTGTLSPGEEVRLHEFQRNAELRFRLPEMDSIWSAAINLGDCIYRDHMGRSVRELLGASGVRDPIVEFIPSIEASNVFQNDEAESKKITARLDYTAADDGSPRIVLYCSLWIYNQSHVETLLLRCAEDAGSRRHASIVTVPQLVPQRPVPRLMDCPKQVFEVSTIVDHEVAKWSDRIHSTVVGIQAPVTLKFGHKLKRRNEIGIAIQRPLGQFHRTTQVVITPRYVFVNKTDAPFRISQSHKDKGQDIELPPCFDMNPRPEPFDFDHGESDRQVFVRMVHNGSEWSGPFSVDEEKEFPLRLRGAVIDGWDLSALVDEDEDDDFRPSLIRLHRVRISVCSIGATIVVTLMKDDPPMYVIRNESVSDLHVHQLNTGSDQVAIVRTNEYLPFAWEKPDGARRVMCSASAPGQLVASARRSYDFASLDRERGIEELKFWIYGGKEFKRVSAEVVVEKASRVLVFRDQNTTKSPKYILEVKVSAVRMRDEIPQKHDANAELHAEIDGNGAPEVLVSKEHKTQFIHRFDADVEFASETRPKHLFLTFYDDQQLMESRVVASASAESSIQVHEDLAIDPHDNDGQYGGDFLRLESPAASPTQELRRRSMDRYVPDSSFKHAQLQHRYSADEPSEASYVVDDEERFDGRLMDLKKKARGLIDIKIPKRAWTKFGGGHKRSITWSYSNAELARRAFGRIDGHWWEMRHPETGDVIGEVQLALKFRTSVKENTSHPSTITNLSVMIPSIGISFLHSANRNATLVEVAYLSMQRIGLLYSQVESSSEVVFSLGNIQMDNQMDAEVVLGPKVHQVKEGVSVRLRDRWRSCINYRYRGVLEQLETTDISVLQFRMLWNSHCNAGDITHYELIELIMQEIEIATDEKFVVNLISVFQGLEGLATQHSFEDIVNTHIDFVGAGPLITGDPATPSLVDESGDGSSTNRAMAVANQPAKSDGGIYIEELQIESIRIKFSMELHGGRYIQTLGPSGRRLAVYLPESNVKDFRLYFTKLMFNHIYDAKSVVVEKLTRHYQQQAVLLVLRGLHTVSVYANPFRIVYRLGHGFLEIVRLPARGLASGSPVELVSGAYLGVRSLAMNTISASYEIVAGASGILAAVIAPLLPEHKRKVFEDDMIGFQRAIMEEVDSFDEAEERTMTKLIVRKPREFDPLGIGLLTVYGPGSLPMEEQDKIDHSAVMLIQNWWRRRRRANIMYAYALQTSPKLREKLEHDGKQGRAIWEACVMM